MGATYNKSFIIFYTYYTYYTYMHIYIFYIYIYIYINMHVTSKIWKNNKINIITNIIQPSIIMKTINKTLISDANKYLNEVDLLHLIQRYEKQMKNSDSNQIKTKNQSTVMNTPSTIDTVFRRSGCAISRSRNNKKHTINHTNHISQINQISQSKGKNIQSNIQATNTNSLLQRKKQEQLSINNDSDVSKVVGTRKILTDKAIFYGKVQLPYLHSSDAISSLYQKSKTQQLKQPLINPPPGINSHLLTNLKSLCLYYTSIDSVRQLGTGWSGLKSLTIMCSPKLKDLSGLSIFPSIQYLFAPHNNIQDISDIMYHSTLRCVDLQDNNLQLMQQIQYLYTINQLEWVDIANNPITKQKQKYRIIVQNLGNKIEPEAYNRDILYVQEQEKFMKQVEMYEKMEYSNYVIAKCNQRMDDGIVVGTVWRKQGMEEGEGEREREREREDVVVYEEEMYVDQYTDALTFFENQIQRDMGDQEMGNQLRFRFTPVENLVKHQEIDIQPLKKYFYNKVCPQSVAQKSEGGLKKMGFRPTNRNNESKSNQKNMIQKISTIRSQIIPASDKQIKKDGGIINARRFAATQNLARINHSQEKQIKQTSLSLKKRLKKLSVPKNIHGMGFETTSSSNQQSHLSFLKLTNDSKHSLQNSNKLLLGKRKLITNHSQNTSQLLLNEGQM